MSREFFIPFLIGYAFCGLVLTLIAFFSLDNYKKCEKCESNIDLVYECNK